MNDTICDFPTRLRDILKKYNWSLTHLASVLGYSSKTSVVRILRGESSYGHQQAFFKKLRARNLLDEADDRALERSLEVSRVGVEAASARKILHDLIHNPEALSGELPQALKDVLDELSAARSARVLAVNCVFPALFSGLRPVLAAHPEFSFDHFFRLGPSETAAAAALSCASQMAYLPNYRAYSIERDLPRRLIFGANLLLASAVAPSGAETDFLVLFADADSLRILRLPAGDRLFRFFSDALEAEKAMCETVTAACHIDAGPATFIDVFQYWLDCESNRNLYQVKPDLCANVIPSRYLRASLLGGGVMKAFPGYSERDVSQMLEALLKLQEARYQNMFFSRRAKHILLSQAALARFAQTGRITEHFEFMRPFTVGERADLLEHLLDQHLHNGYFTLYFWKDPEIFPAMEVDCMDELGVTAFPSVCPPDARKGYCCSMILHPRLIASFRDYFMDDLRRNRTLPDAQAVRFLKSLVLDLRSRPAG